MKSFVSLIGFIRNFKWDLSVTFAAAAHHKPKSQRSTVTPNTWQSAIPLTHLYMHQYCLPPPPEMVPTSSPAVYLDLTFANNRCKHNLIEEGIHPSCLSFFLKGQQPEEHEILSCGTHVFMCSGVCVRLKAPYKSSLKVQTTFCVFSEVKARGIFCLVYASVCSQLPCPVSEWTNTQHDKTHQSAAIRCPRSCYTFSFLAVSPWERQPKTFLSHLFSVAAKCCLIGLVNFLHPCFLSSLCTALLSCIRLPLPCLSLS